MVNIYAVVMAGGSGERFWPMSRRKMPKQLLPILSKKSMLQETVARLKGLVPDEKICVVTNKLQADIVKKQLPKIKIIAEPVSKNTAPCIAVAASMIYKKDPDAVMIILPSDHRIKNVKGFKKTIFRAVMTAYKNNVLITLGIKPKTAHIGYGYIKKGERIDNNSFRVERFTEKPDLGRAKEYVESGKYLWNSGMFIWRADDILKDIKRYMPDLYNLCRRYGPDAVYRKAKNVSIDYGVMEKTRKAGVIEAGFDWDDVGNWAAIDSHLKKDGNKNIINGKVIYRDVENSTIRSDSPLIAVIGLKNIVIVAEKNAVLVCPKERAEEVKHIVSMLKKNKDYGEYV